MKNLKPSEVNPREFYQIVLLKKGTINIRIGDHDYPVKGPCLYFLAPGQPSKLLSHSKEPEGICLTFDTDYFLLCLKNQVQLAFYPFFQWDQHPILPLAKSHFDSFNNLVGKIAYEYNNRSSINDNLLAKLHLNILLIEIERLYKAKSTAETPKRSRKQHLASRYKQLVEQNFLKLRMVSAYAEIMFIAPNYLNDAVRETTGKSASQVISDRIVLEAKAWLIQSELSVREIAYQLEFKDTSYFCRFFKKQTGMSPQSYRETHHS